MPELKELTLENAANGVAPELFARELAKVLENIKDPNTDAKPKRQILLRFTFLPSEDRNGARSEMGVVVQSDSKLAPVRGHGSFAFIARRGDEAVAYTNDVQQEEMELPPPDRETGEVLDMKTRRPGA